MAIHLSINHFINITDYIQHFILLAMSLGLFGMNGLRKKPSHLVGPQLISGNEAVWIGSHWPKAMTVESLVGEVRVTNVFMMGASEVWSMKTGNFKPSIG